MTPTIKQETQNLKGKWANLRAENPHLRIRDAAEKLNVSEAELLATEIGASVVLLEPKCARDFAGTRKNRRIMALTRNEEIVHERKGEYKNVEIMSGHAQMALAVNEDIDLRIFLVNWHFAFAVTNESQRGTMRSLQFFDIDGTAVHKVFLTEKSNLDEYEKIIEKYRHPNQNETLEFKAKPAKEAEKPDSEIDIEGFRKGWAKFKRHARFLSFDAKVRRVAREQALRVADREMAYEVDAKKFSFRVGRSRERKASDYGFRRKRGNYSDSHRSRRKSSRRARLV
ncbi:hemin-degrading factor [Biomphalaria pfeifferi]|uniref:Hemin-degrading factor n=1 Tax=Biomphalaria pfeifferi TaxID=112525 RepID=A0AAD8AN83_BIOPF|nr:hemin-degrading factor [Biomphalaria pfeifferi]